MKKLLFIFTILFSTNALADETTLTAEDRRIVCEYKCMMWSDNSFDACEKMCFAKKIEDIQNGVK